MSCDVGKVTERFENEQSQVVPTMDQNIRQIYKDGPPWICGQQNVRVYARDNTGQDTKDVHPIPDLKFLARSTG